MGEWDGRREEYNRDRKEEYDEKYFHRGVKESWFSVSESIHRTIARLISKMPGNQTVFFSFSSFCDNCSKSICNRINNDETHMTRRSLFLQCPKMVDKGTGAIMALSRFFSTLTLSPWQFCSRVLLSRYSQNPPQPNSLTSEFSHTLLSLLFMLSPS